jgi:hypothetical protein
VTLNLLLRQRTIINIRFNSDEPADVTHAAANESELLLVTNTLKFALICASFSSIWHGLWASRKSSGSQVRVVRASNAAAQVSSARPTLDGTPR